MGGDGTVVASFFDFSQFMPHGHCYLWEPGILWTHVVSDGLIALAYYSIPVALLMFYYKRPSLEYRWILLLFGLFIFACGTTHLLAIVTVWQPYYGIDGLVKAGTAAASIATAIVLWPLLPRALTIPGPGELMAANKRLHHEIQEREKAQLELNNLNRQLEQRVQDRTAELEGLNERLQREIDERSRAEQRLTNIIKALPTGVLMVGADGSIALANPQAASLLGYEQAQLTGRQVEELVPAHARHRHQDYRQSFQRHPETRMMGQGRDLYCVRKDGEEVPVEIGLNPIAGSGQLEVVVSVTDITERKQAAARIAAKSQQLEVANAELRRSNDELDQFAYIASHDLKEPLRGIQNYIRFLKEDYEPVLDDKGVERLDALNNESKSLQNLIDSLLEFSRVGRAETASERVDMHDLVREVMGRAEHSHTETPTDISVVSELPSVSGDRTLLGEVFMNLVSNAIKYNDKDVAKIEIGCNGEQAEPGRAVFFVRDNGIGIAQRHKDRVFRIFKRLHGKDAYGGGTGIGLTLVQKIIDKHQGRIWFESGTGGGTTFHFSLPLA